LAPPSFLKLLRVQAENHNEDAKHGAPARQNAAVLFSVFFAAWRLRRFGKRALSIVFGKRHTILKIISWPVPDSV
jgi:hypothetical protein